ncbi:hypothetical protein ABH944_004027 [Caballeronia udeis]|jgi:hypothetical protein|uniref:Cbb3-type cytochrome oxidase component FixQ n=1 Tax=Caballeronia udeis TaxID=1232866 RepID=A0ABW8MJ23_9BURK
MSHALFEISSVICILLFVGFVVFRAFTSPLPEKAERFDLFMEQHDITRSRDTPRHESLEPGDKTPRP